MDEELQQLEAELRRLRPRVPSAEMRRRIEDDLRKPESPRLAWFWTALPLAAAVALAFFVRFQPEPRSASAPVGASLSTVATALEPLAPRPVFKPVAVDNLLYAAHDDGIVTLADGSKARRTRKAYLDTVVWRNPHTNASLTWTVPRSEVAVVPVAFQ